MAYTGSWYCIDSVHGVKEPESMLVLS